MIAVTGQLLGAAGFLGWMLVRTVQNSPSTQRWSLIGIERGGGKGQSRGRGKQSDTPAS